MPWINLTLRRGAFTKEMHELMASTLEQVIARAPNLVGMKHAVNDLAFATQCLARFGPAFRLFVGLEDKGKRFVYFFYKQKVVDASPSTRVRFYRRW